MPTKKKKTAKVEKIGRDSGTGEFISVKEAKKHPKTTQVETIKRPSNTRSRQGP